MARGAWDVIVVGSGLAGLTAALTAARAGAKTLLLEKNPSPGGTSRLSVGSFSVNRSPQQRSAGIDDSPDAHFEDMAKFAEGLQNRDNLAMRRVYVDEIGPAFEFLISLGLVFMNPVPEPPHRVPRLHNVLPHAGALIRTLLRHAVAAGVEVRTNASVSRLTVEGGEVTGVHLDGEEELVARRGVILASGDYSSAAPSQKNRYLPTDIAGIEGINPSSTGDGHRMGEGAGGVVLNPDLAWGPELRFIAPPRHSLVARIPPVRAFAQTINAAMKLLPGPLLRPFLMSFVTTFLAPSPGLFREGAVLVNAEGQRFAAEADGPERVVAQQPDGIAYILLDDAVARKFTAWPHFVSTAPGVAYAYLPDYRRNRRDIYYSATTIPELAHKAGLPVEALTTTVADYNAAGIGPALVEPPFVLLGPLKAWICFTEGGLKVDTSLRVLRIDDGVIPGLFAAGSAGQGGLLLEGHGHHLGWAVVSGRIAGAAAASAPERVVSEGSVRDAASDRLMQEKQT